MTFALPTAPTLDTWSAPRLRWGVIGTGIGAAFTASVHRHTPHRVIAMAAQDPVKTEKAATTLGVERSYSNAEGLIADPDVDAVYVATPHPRHAEIAIQAINAGKPVLIEKPIAMSRVEAETVLTAARSAGVLAMEAMWTRYLPQADIIRRLLADGVLGDVNLVRADFGISMPFDRSSRLWNRELGGGALLDAGVYPVAFASEVFGPARSLVALGTVTADGVDASAHLMLDYGDERTSLLSTSLISALPARAEIVGTDGRIELASPFFAPTQLFVTVGHWGAFKHASWAHPGYEPGEPVSDGYAWQAVAFARYLAEGRIESPIHTHSETLSIMGMLDDARRQIIDSARPAPIEEAP